MIEIIPHTADVRLRVSAPSVEDLFGESLRGLMTCMDAHAVPGGRRVRRELEVVSADRTTLLVDFLNDALAMAIVDRETYSEILFHSFEETQLSATLSGFPAIFGEDVKAVTYHEAEIVQREDGTWCTFLVFDI